VTGAKDDVTGSTVIARLAGWILKLTILSDIDIYSV
jgi:hypothetical protein